MSNIDINKEGLFSMVRRITQENSSISNKFPIKSSKLTKKILLPNSFTKRINLSPKIENLNISPKIPSKKATIFKNKFLEKNNIQINEQNVLHLLSERRKKKLADIKTLRNNDNIYFSKILRGKTVEINLDENKTNYNKKEIRTIKNSNSENFEIKGVNKSPELNMDYLIKNSKSFFKMLEKKNNNGMNKSNINNNININININGDLNNNKKIKNLFKANKRIIHYFPTQENHTTKIIKDKANNNNNNNLSYNISNQNNSKRNIIQDKVKKMNHKTFYLNNITKFGDEDESQHIEDNERKKDMEHNNTVNINLNFI